MHLRLTLNTFKTGWRSLKRSPVYSTINLVGLSIGLACSMLILLYIKDEVSYDRFQPNLKRLYRITNSSKRPDTGERRSDPNTGFFQGPRFAANAPGIADYCRIQETNEDVKHGLEIKSQTFFRVDPSFFRMFHFPLISGNPKTCLQQPDMVVLSEDAAIQYFGTKDAVGKVLRLREDGNFKDFQVSGVAKRCPQNSSIKFDALLPFRMSKDEAENPQNWFNFFLNTFVLLEPNASPQQVANGMQRFFEKDSKEAIRLLTEQFGPLEFSMRYGLQSMESIHLDPELPAQNGLQDASNPMYSYILTAIAVFILLIACINFVNLTVARSVRRAREIGIRKAIGSNRTQLIFQFLGESYLLCALAFILALILAQVALPLFNELSNKALSLSYLFDAQLIGAYLLLFFLTGLLAGVYPALVLSSYDPVQTLYSRFQLAGKNYLQKGLVVLQFGLASFLIVGTFTLYSQFRFLTRTDLGYSPQHLVHVPKYGLRDDEVIRLRQELKGAQILEVIPKNHGNWGTTAKVNGDSSVNFQYETVDQTYVPQFGLKLVQGRNFSADFPGDSTHSVLVNEAFVRKAGWKNPIGQEVNFWYNDGEKYQVIGVVKDYHFAPLNEVISPQLFTMKPSNGYGSLYFKIRPGSETAALKKIESVFKRLFPLSPYTYTFLDEDLKKQYQSEEKWKQMVLFSSVLTIFISCIGLFGLSVLAAEKRTREIGIRKVLGASVQHVAGLLSGDFVLLVGLSLLISFPLAWMASTRWLENYAYRIEPGWQMFAGAGLLVLAIAVFTVSFQALKVAMANPVKSLRTE